MKGGCWAKTLSEPHLRHLVLHDLLDAHQLLRLQRRVKAPHLERVQLCVIQRVVLQAADPRRV